MNLYLLIVVALGAITGIAEVPVARPAFAVVSATSNVRAARRAVSSCAAGFQPAVQPHRKRRLEAGATRTEVPLTGAASPRAPAQNC